MEPSKPRWWAVRALFEMTIGADDASSDMVQDSIFVVLADSEREAVRRGAEFAERANHEYEGGYGEIVRVRFSQVTDVHETLESELYDGMEVYVALEAGSSAQDLRQRARMRGDTEARPLRNGASAKGGDDPKS